MGPDWVYVDDLMDDLFRRAALSPDETFKYICEMNIGPLITDSISDVNLQQVSLKEMYPGFILYTRTRQ